jgi:hypothetical protein
MSRKLEQIFHIQFIAPSFRYSIIIRFDQSCITEKISLPISNIIALKKIRCNSRIIHINILDIKFLEKEYPWKHQKIRLSL